MGEVISFPDHVGDVCRGRYIDVNKEPAVVIILPVIRINEDLMDEQLRVSSRKRGNPRKPKK
jgi:hypothetical protein